jgi:PAS domain S-box-containing protein
VSALIDYVSERHGVDQDSKSSQRALATVLEGSLAGSELWRGLVDALPAAVYTTDAEGIVTYCNDAAVELSGRQPVIGSDRWCVSWRLYWPDGTPMPHDQCPMAIALRENRPVRDVEAVIEQPDGTRIPVMPYPTPLRDSSGTLVGAVNMLVDISDRKRAENVRHHLAAIVESSYDAIVSKTLDGIITSWNKGSERLFGYTAEQIIGKSVTILIPADRQDEEQEILGRIHRGQRVESYETVRQRRDGTLIDVSLTISPIRNGGGQIVGASKIARDITDRRRAEQQRTLLLREMSHRVKNLFAVASSVVGLSARSARNPQEMAEAVRQRLSALARAQDLTRPGLLDARQKANTTTLHALLQAIFLPYCDQDRRNKSECLVVTGPDVPLSEGAVTSFALVLHEFATNAAKYGALASPNGHVRIDCIVANDRLQLIWQEHGGLPLSGPPHGEGFGSFLARQTVLGQFGGELLHDWRPEGVVIRLAIPLERLAQ